MSFNTFGEMNNEQVVPNRLTIKNFLFQYVKVFSPDVKAMFFRSFITYDFDP